MVGKWVGSGSRDTELFPISAEQWRIIWESPPSGPKHGMLLIFVIRKEKQREVIAEKISNMTIQNQGANWRLLSYPPGQYFLKIVAGDVTPWSVVVEEVE
ncbi:MAG: hypothetical protein D6704_00580 [Nitrospirae bacterium]|nr:MAG: hypothetical protein D6704_00580 [Nitrospirota bacterium]